MITKTNMGFSEVVDSLTGFDEEAIEQRFASDVTTLLNTHATRGVRAGVFVVLARDLKKQDVVDPDDKAYQRVMEMTIGEVNAFFEDEDEDEDDDVPAKPSVAAAPVDDDDVRTCAVSAEFVEFLGTMTGAEEVAIRESFGQPIEAMTTGYAQRRAAQFRQAPSTSS